MDTSEVSADQEPSGQKSTSESQGQKEDEASATPSSGDIETIGQQEDGGAEAHQDRAGEEKKAANEARASSAQGDKISDDSPDESDAQGEEEKKSGEEDEDELDFQGSVHMDGVERNQLYQRGLEYEASGKQKLALQCYLACLRGLRTDTQFTLLPQCLSSIGAIYGDMQEYDKAICFKQAEKLYYENALIDTNEIQKRLEDMQAAGEEVPGNTAEALLRAAEYENLARILMDKEDSQLALEYAAKACKIRQKELGNDDPMTQETLNFFASVYAAVGKKQYSESLKDLQEDADEPSTSASNAEGTENSPSSILRNRKTSRNKEKKQVRFDESANQELETETDRRIRVTREDYISYGCVWLLFVVCSAVLILLGMYLYCRLATNDRSCKTFIQDIHGFLSRMRMYYYYYFEPRPSKSAYAR